MQEKINEIDAKINRIGKELIDCSADKDKEINDLRFALREVDSKINMMLIKQVETNEMLKAWQTAQGFVKVIEVIAKFMKAVSPIVIFIGMAYYFIKTGGHLPKD